jgi:hypothetical protein
MNADFANGTKETNSEVEASAAASLLLVAGMGLRRLRRPMKREDQIE